MRPIAHPCRSGPTRRSPAAFGSALVRRLALFPILIALAASLFAARSNAQWREFLPHPVENRAYLDAYTSYERDHLESNGRTSWWEDIFFREKLTLESRGYSYHPRFVQYRFSIAGALRQEEYNTGRYRTKGWSVDPGFEYDTTLYLLPEHSYNLEVFARRFEPLYKERAATRHSSVQARQGLDFRYRRKPWFAHAGYVHDKIDNSMTSAELNRLNLDGQYFKRFTGGNELSFSGSVNPMWFSTSDGRSGDTFYYSTGNYLNLQDVPRWAVPIRLTSNVSQTWYTQNNISMRDTDNDQFLWYEWLTVTLPWRFRSDVYYRYQDNTVTAPGYQRDYQNRDLKIDLIHRLYESLDSVYTYRNVRQDSSGGDSVFSSNALAFNYAKTIPTGRLLVNTNLSRGEADIAGQVSVVDENFSAEVPMLQPYVLGQANVDPSLIAVYFKNPLPPFDLQYLEPQYYTKVPAGNTYGIQITSMPAAYALPNSYDFLVSYSFSGDYSLRTDTVGTTASVQLIENLVTPYFSYMRIASDVRGGYFPGVPVDSISYTSGVMFRYSGLQLRGEYQKYEWEIAPFDGWRADMQYVGVLDAYTNLFLSGSYLHRKYPRGSSFYYSIPFTEDTETATGNIQRQFFDRTLFVSIGGTYMHTDSIVDSDSATVNSSLLWRIGKVDLSMGGNVYLTESSGAYSVSTKRDHQFIWMNLRRRLF